MREVDQNNNNINSGLTILQVIILQGKIIQWALPGSFAGVCVPSVPVVPLSIYDVFHTVLFVALE